jgi:hypothetical protein
VFKQSACLLAALASAPVLAATEDRHSVAIVLPPVIIDYSGVAEALYRSQGAVAACLAAAVLLIMLRLPAVRPAPSAGDPDARRAGRVWGVVLALLAMALAVPAVRFWAVLTG